MYVLWYCGYLHRAVVWDVSNSLSEENTATIFRVEMSCILMMQAVPLTCWYLATRRKHCVVTQETIM